MGRQLPDTVSCRWIIQRGDAGRGSVWVGWGWGRGGGGLGWVEVEQVGAAGASKQLSPTRTHSWRAALHCILSLQLTLWIEDILSSDTHANTYTRTHRALWCPYTTLCSFQTSQTSYQARKKGAGSRSCQDIEGSFTDIQSHWFSLTCIFISISRLTNSLIASLAIVCFVTNQLLTDSYVTQLRTCCVPHMK